MLREAVDLRGGVNGDGEPRRQVSPDEVTNDLENCIIHAFGYIAEAP